MQGMQPTLRNGRSIWSPINMPFEEFQSRIDILRSKMAEHRIDVLLAYGYAFNHYGNPCYLSNYVIRLPRGSLVALTPGDVTLFFEGASRGLPSAKKLTWIEDMTNGNNGLPVIVSDLIINGNGATIKRAENADHFRILQIGTKSTVTINDLRNFSGEIKRQGQRQKTQNPARASRHQPVQSRCRQSQNKNRNNSC